MESVKSLARVAAAAGVCALALLGCATVPQYSRAPANYIQKGMASERLKGGEFYMAIGDVDLYDYGLFGDLRPSGKTIEIAAVIEADKTTGEVLKIATQQSDTNERVASKLSDLRGGMSIIDLQSYPRWLDAVAAMRDAITKLDTTVSFAADGQGESAPVVAVVGLGLGWRWWGGPLFFRRHYWR